MITRMSHTSVFVLDQDSAKAFYTEKLGFEVRFDITMGEEFEGAGAGFRWLTVGAEGPARPPDHPLLVRHGSFSRGGRAAARPGRRGLHGRRGHDHRRLPATYEELLAKGVTFLAEPAERPYGIEATLRDDSGNMMSLVQPFAFG